MSAINFSNFRLLDQKIIQSKSEKGKELLVSLDKRHQVVATLVNQFGSEKLVIEKVPEQARRSIKDLYEFLRDTHGRVVFMTGGGGKVYFHHRVKGGMPPRAEQAERIDLEQVRQVTRYAKAAQGKDVIAFFGNAGVGKSTIVNHMLNVKLSVIDDPKPFKRRIAAIDPAQERAKIGHARARSETLFTHVYSTNIENQMLADCGDCFGAAGAASLITPLSIVHTLRNARSVKSVLCLTYLEITNPDAKCRFLGNQIKIIYERLVNYEYRQVFLDNLLILVTKGNKEETFPSKDRVRRAIEEIAEDLDRNHPLRHVYNKILEGDKIQIYDPTSESSRSLAERYLNSVQPINAPGRAIVTPYSEDAENVLLETLAQINRRARAVYARYREAGEQLSWMEERISRENAERDQVQRLLIEERDGADDSIEAISETIRNLKGQIERLKTEIEQKKGSLTQIKIQRAREEALGETEMRYMTLPVDPNNPDVVIRGKPRRTIVWYAGFLPVGTKIETPPIIGYRERLVYRDQPITKVVHYPGLNEPCWTNEIKDLDAGEYSIHYNGRDPSARVDIHVKKKYFPGYQEELTQLSDNQNEIECTIGRRNLELRNLEEQVRRNEETVSQLRSRRTQKRFFEDKITTLNNHIEVLQLHQGAMINNKREALERMREERREVQFLYDFLSLCSEELRNQEIFAEFITFYRTFQNILDERG